MRILKYKDEYRSKIIPITKKIFGYSDPVAIKYIATEDDKIIGYISYFLYDKDNAHIHELGTLVQNKGIGTKLMLKALDRLQNVHRITLYVDRKKPKLLDYYKRFGFKVSTMNAPGGNFMMVRINKP